MKTADSRLSAVGHRRPWRSGMQQAYGVKLGVSVTPENVVDAFTRT